MVATGTAAPGALTYPHGAMDVRPGGAPSADGRDHGWTRPALLGGAAIVASGGALRIGLYLSGRSFASDEAKLALCIAGETFGSLLEPLPHDQVAPVPYLWLERALFLALGPGERALRLPSLAAGLAGLVLLAALVRRLSGPAAGLLALALASASPLLVRYGVELKPYGLDALAALGLVWLTLDVLDDPASDRRRWRLLAAGALALAVSLPAVFVTAGAAAALLVTAEVRSRIGRGRLALAGAAWAASFGLVYTLSYRHAARHEYFTRFWEGRFLRPWNDGGRRSVEALGQVLSDLLDGRPRAFGGTLTLGLAAVALAGLVAVRRRRGAGLTVLLAVPTGAVAVASLLGLYPIASRLLVFVAPLWLLLLAEGVSLASTKLPGRRTPLLALALIGVLAPYRPVLRQLRDLADPSQEEDAGRLLARMRERRTSGQPVYLFSRAVPPWVYYTTDWGAPDLRRHRWYADLTSSTGRAFYNAPSRGRPVTAEEAGGLTYAGPGGLELLGLPTGLAIRAGRSIGHLRPDPGWAEVEAARIHDVARPDVWLFLSHFFECPAQAEELLRAVEERGGRVRERLESPRTRLLLLRFGPTVR